MPTCIQRIVLARPADLASCSPGDHGLKRTRLVLSVEAEALFTEDPSPVVQLGNPAWMRRNKKNEQTKARRKNDEQEELAGRF